VSGKGWIRQWPTRCAFQEYPGLLVASRGDKVVAGPQGPQWGRRNLRYSAAGAAQVPAHPLEAVHSEQARKTTALAFRPQLRKES
jgi:hypothetical protein